MYLPEGFLVADVIVTLLTNIADGMHVWPGVVTARVMSELPFMATENILMACVKVRVVRGFVSSYVILCRTRIANRRHQKYFLCSFILTRKNISPWVVSTALPSCSAQKMLSGVRFSVSPLCFGLVRRKYPHMVGNVHRERNSRRAMMQER